MQIKIKINKKRINPKNQQEKSNADLDCCMPYGKAASTDAAAYTPRARCRLKSIKNKGLG
jgi:hypothetical protein